MHSDVRSLTLFAAMLLAALQSTGCAYYKFQSALESVPADALANMPRELAKTSLPDYRIEPPDVLIIEAIKVVPKAPYRIETLDVLQVQVLGALPEQPIAGSYQVQPDGNLDLGPPYGAVYVERLTIQEAVDAVQKHLDSILTESVVSISLVQSGARQQIEGEHNVGPDGKVQLGVYGAVFITGMTVAEAKLAIEEHLSQFLEKPQVSVDMYAYNSMVYYVVQQGAGQGDSIDRFPVTGNETVLDALSNINGLSNVSSKRIWVARPAPHGVGHEQMLPVDYCAIVSGAATTTNYQLMPGDRLFIAEDKLLRLNNAIAKLTAPGEQVFGFTLLGANTVRMFSFFGGGSNAFLGGGGFF
jgi:polysaccharide export outer membrane protein